MVFLAINHFSGCSHLLQRFVEMEFGPESLKAARGVLRLISNFRDGANAYISGIQTAAAFAEVPLWERCEYIAKKKKNYGNAGSFLH